MTEKEKMLQGLLYDGGDPVLIKERIAARKILYILNRAKPHQKNKIKKQLYQLIKTSAKNIWIEPPFYCDYGYNIEVGDNFYANFDCVFLDVCQIKIGNTVLLGPKVQLYTATHPINPDERKTLIEFAKPITIGNNVWIGGGSIVCPGVTIGNNSVIGAGSVVTKNIPDNILAVGNPCKVIKQL